MDLNKDTNKGTNKEQDFNTKPVLRNDIKVGTKKEIIRLILTDLIGKECQYKNINTNKNNKQDNKNTKEEFVIFYCKENNNVREYKAFKETLEKLDISDLDGYVNNIFHTLTRED